MSAKRKYSARTSPDQDEVPELDAEWIKGADYHEGKRLVRRGRPKLEKPRQLLSLRLVQVPYFPDTRTSGMTFRQPLAAAR